MIFTSLFTSSFTSLPCLLNRSRKLLFAACLCTPVFVFAQTLAPKHTVPDTLEQRLKPCTSCHGKDGRAASDGYYPRIAGKPVGYLFNQLKNFREGKRTYPLMTYMVANMSDEYLHEIAQYFSRQHPPYSAPPSAEIAPAVLQRGRLLVQQGEPAQKIPACIACHGEKMTGVAPNIPGLLGLPRDYIVAQLGAWQTSGRRAYAPDCMQQVARKLTPPDIYAVSAWLAAQNMPVNSLAIDARDIPNFKMPLSCGSVPQSVGQH
jgi:cytochrome c553